MSLQIMYVLPDPDVEMFLVKLVFFYNSVHAALPDVCRLCPRGRKTLKQHDSAQDGTKLK